MIVFLQETWLTHDELYILKSLHPYFYADGVSAMDTSCGMTQGRPFVGIGILWRKSIGSCIHISLPVFPFVRGEVLPATFSPPHLLVFSTLLCLLPSASSIPPLMPSSHLS